MSNHTPGRPAHPRRPKLIGQLTVGECIAIARYAPHYLDPGSGTTDLNRLMQLLDDLNVCTTCGWPEHTHALDGIDAQALEMCAQFTDRG
jgi:hypothetical protein